MIEFNMFLVLLTLPVLVETIPIILDGNGGTMTELEVIYNDVESLKNPNVPIIPRGECTECYNELGCFDKCKGVLSHAGELPLSPDEISTRFTLYSRYASNFTPTSYPARMPSKLSRVWIRVP